MIQSYINESVWGQKGRVMTKYEQIIDDIKAMIQAGDLVQGDRLPAIRRLSETYGCNKDTVSKALLALKYQNIIYSKEKSGTYVLQGNITSDSELSDVIDFGNAMPDERLFPYADFRQCLDQAIQTKQTKLFTYHLNHKGLDDLVDALYLYLKQEQVYTQKESILITTGIQQALYILSQIPFPNDKSVILIEQPTYHMMNQLLVAEKIEFETIHRDHKGVDLYELEQLFKTKSIKFFYTIPRFSNPLGTFYTAKQKQKIVSLAEQYDVYIVEDDYLSDFDVNHNNLPLHYYDVNQRVIYLKSFSKIIFPALRIGCCVLPEAIIETFLAKKVLIDYDTNLITQMALALYLDSGMFDKHRKGLAKIYRKKARALHQTLRDLGYAPNHFDKTLDTKFVFQLKDDVAIHEIERQLIQENISVDFMVRNFIQLPQKHYIKIDVRNMTQKKIAENVKKLVAIIHDSVRIDG